MAQIKRSPTTPLLSFVIDGLEHLKGKLGVFYKDEYLNDDELLKIGVESKGESTRAIQDAIHYFEYTDGTGAAYTSVDSLVGDLISLISEGDNFQGLQGILNRADLEGFTKPSQSVQDEMSALIDSMKATGIWNKQDLFLNFAYNDVALQDFSRINWKAPSDPLISLFGGLSYDSEGFQGDNVNGYIDMEHNLSSYGGNYLLNDASRFAVIRDLDTGGGINAAIDSAETGGLNNYMTSSATAAHSVNSNQVASGPEDTSGDGLKMLDRPDSSTLRIYNKSVSSSFTQPSTSIFNANQVLLKIDTFYGFDKILCYGLGGSMFSEAQQFRSDYNTYLVNIGLTAIA